MARKSKLKKFFIFILIICLIHLSIILLLALTSKPRLYDQIENLSPTCNIFNFDKFFIVEKDEYGRALCSSNNMAEFNKSSNKKVMVLYYIFYFSEKSPLIRYIPDNYYFLAFDSNRESEDFKQFLKDNFWGVKYDDSIKNNYVTIANYYIGYDVSEEKRQEKDKKVESKITEYIIKNELFNIDDYEFVNKIYDRFNKYIYGIIQKSTGNLYGAYINYENIENGVKILPLSYDNYRNDLNALKKSVCWYETAPIE